MNRLASFFFLLALYPAFAGAQETSAPHPAAKALAGAGFGNIRVVQRNDTLYVGAENRAWRYAPRGMAEILRTAGPLAGTASVISVTIFRQGVPVTTVSANRAALRHWTGDTAATPGSLSPVTADFAGRSCRSVFRGMRAIKPLAGRTDLILAPQFRAQFGNYDDPLEMQLNIVPTVRVSVAKGLTATAAVIVPLYSDLPGDPDGRRIRPGVISLDYTTHLPQDLFWTVSAGHFTRNRYGLNAEARYFFFGNRFAAGVTAGYTGYLRNDGSELLYSPPDRLTGSCYASWRWARYDLTVTAGYHRFLAGDEGWRADVWRRFGEVSAGFWAMQSDGVMNGGFRFTVPLPPRRYGTKHAFRIRPPSYVDWEYRARGLPSAGHSFGTGFGTDDFLQDLHPDLIRSRIGSMLREQP